MIDTLSDDVLLYIFNSYRQEFAYHDCRGAWPWHKFVHVCRRWRRIVFAFPGYLDVHLRCKSNTHVQATLDIWPALPLSIDTNLNAKDADEDDIIGALEHRDRMAGIYLGRLDCSQLKKCIALMQEPFPILRSLLLEVDATMTFVITDTFLGGSAPLLQWISLRGVLCPSLPKFLSSTSDLVYLSLKDIPTTGEGHISPDAMTACLSELTKLQYLTITFPQEMSFPYPTDQRPPPSIYTILPALTYLWLEGPHGYLEDLVGRVDAPILTSGHLELHDEPVFDTPRIPQFIHRTKIFKLLSKVDMYFRRNCGLRRRNAGIYASFRSPTGSARFSMSLPCSVFSDQVAIMEQIFTQWPPLVAHVESLKLYDVVYEEEKSWEGITPWLGPLRPFTAVRTLQLGGMPIVALVARILGELEGERATEVLPALRTIELGYSEPGASDSFRLLLGPFLDAREESEHPVAVNVGFTS